MTAPDQYQRKEKEEQWAKRNGLKKSARGNGGLKFLNKKAPEYQLPAGDHVTYWNKNGKPYCIVSQPYGVYSGELKDAILLAEKYDLEFAINAYPSWHFPMNVVSMIWTKKVRL